MKILDKAVRVWYNKGMEREFCAFCHFWRIRMERCVVKSSRKGMPSRSAIKQYWIETSMPMLKCYGRGELRRYNLCFACGMEFDHNLDRAHIVPLMYGGTNECTNLHLLCGSCHKESEYMDDDNGIEYYKWFFGVNND